MHWKPEHQDFFLTNKYVPLQSCKHALSWLQASNLKLPNLKTLPIFEYKTQTKSNVLYFYPKFKEVDTKPTSLTLVPEPLGKQWVSVYQNGIFVVKRKQKKSSG